MDSQMITYWWLVPVCFTAYLLTAVVRGWALSNKKLASPNDRSSHVLPTPSGGGVSIAFCVLSVLVMLAILDQVLWQEVAPLIGAGFLVAVIGWLDDQKPVAVRWRLFVQLLAAGWVLYSIDGMPVITAFGLNIDFGGIGYVIGIFYIVWLINLFNFMDGIDAIASVESITVCIGAVVLAILTGNDFGLLVALVLACSTLGFLAWNLPPAKIFMGDCGSYFIGVVLAVLSLQFAWFKQELFWSWLILLGIFIVDATWTLISRLLQGHKVYVAHRSHAYQNAARGLGAHGPVSLGVGLINLFWLLPLSLLVALGYLGGVEGIVAAYSPLVLLAIKYRSGRSEVVMSGP